MNKETYTAYCDILRSELIPAMGCTEPIALALTAAIARKHLEGDVTDVHISTSGNIIKNAKEGAYKDQVIVIEKAAKSWSVDNADKIKDDGEVYNLEVNDLLNGGYISNDTIKDPRNSSKTLSGHVEIKYDSNYKQFIYKYVDN